jgi:7-keto-8-aminopelargonate synthetase-like enzyme
VPPPVLGAAVASAKIHLSADIYSLQKQLQEKIKFFNQTASLLELPMYSNNISPVKFICLGKPTMGYNMVSRLMNAGYYVNLSVFPSVSYNNTGMRIPLSLHMTKEDIEGLLNEIATQMPLAFKETGSSLKEVTRFFKLDKKEKVKD